MKRFFVILLIFLLPAAAGAVDFEASTAGGVTIDDFTATDDQIGFNWKSGLGLVVNDNAVVEASYRKTDEIEIRNNGADTDIDILSLGVRYYPSSRLVPDGPKHTAYFGFDLGWMDLESVERDDDGVLVGLRFGIEHALGHALTFFGETGYVQGVGNNIDDVGLLDFNLGFRVHF